MTRAHLDLSSLMIIVEYLPNIKCIQTFTFVNKKCADTLYAFKINPEIHEHISHQLLSLFPNIQTLSCSFEDYQNLGLDDQYERYKFRLTHTPISNLNPFEQRITFLKLGFFNGICPILPSIFVLTSYKRLRELEINASPHLQTLECPTITTRLKISECKELTSVIAPPRLAMLSLYDCTSISNLPSVDLTRLELMKCHSIQFLNLTNMPRLNHVIVSGCSQLLDLCLPNMVTTLELDDCGSLQRLDLSTSLKSLSFFYCGALRTLTIPDGVKSVNLVSFNKLSSITVDNCKEMTSLRLWRCETVGQCLLGSSIKRIELIDSLRCTRFDISHYQFLKEVILDHCRTLQHVSFPTQLEKLRIDHCENINELILPDSLLTLSITKCPLIQSISTNAFVEILLQCCEGIFEITTPNAKKCSIYNCPSLSVKELNDSGLPTITLSTLQM
ncbi:Leucine-rich repeat containing protein [Entamoeba marina]